MFVVYLTECQILIIIKMQSFNKKFSVFYQQRVMTVLVERCIIRYLFLVLGRLNNVEVSH